MALRVLFELPMVGATADGQPLDGPGVIGGPFPDDILSDGNTATAIEVAHYVGPSGVIYNGIEGYFTRPAGYTDPEWAALFDSSARVWARIFSDKPIQNVVIETAGTGLESGVDWSIGSIIETPGGWYYPMDANAWERVAVADGTAPYTSLMRVQVPLERDDTGETTTISEAWIVVAVAGEAPPCRIFPREDGLGVGGGRNYPPAKSQQRSNRGVGYY